MIGQHAAWHGALTNPTIPVPPLSFTLKSISLAAAVSLLLQDAVEGSTVGQLPSVETTSSIQLANIPFDMENI